MRTSIVYGMLWLFLTFYRNTAEHVLDSINSYDIEKFQKNTFANINNFKLNLRQTIPGEPDRDYPIYSSVPDTSFVCSEKHEGYYSDIESRCQAFRICTHTAKTPQGFGVLCPNGTLFNQKLLVCDWYRNVNCSESEFFYNNNIFDVGNDYEIMKTIRHMIEYPIFMLKQKKSDSGSSSVQSKLEEQDMKYSIQYEILDYKSNVYVNNLGELTTDVDESSFIKNIYEPQILDGDDYKTYNDSTLALKINNLMETDTISNIKLNESDYMKERPYRFISHGFSAHNEHLLANKTSEWSNLQKEDFKNVNHLSNNSQQYLTNNKTEKVESTKNYANNNYKNEPRNVLHIISKSDSTNVLSQKKIELLRATEIRNISVGNKNILPNISKSLRHEAYVPKYATNLLLDGIIQSVQGTKTFTQSSNKQNLENTFHVDVDTYDNDVKHIYNFVSRRNTQRQKSPTATSAKHSVSTSNISNLYPKRIHANRFRLHRFSNMKSEMAQTTEAMPLFKKSTNYSIEKKLIRNINKNESFVNNLSSNSNVKNMSTYQPNYNSVYNSLQRYRITKNDSLDNSKSMTTFNSSKTISISPTVVLKSSSNDNNQEFSLVNNFENTPYYAKITANSNDPSSKINFTNSSVPTSNNISFETQNSIIINSIFKNSQNKSLINSSIHQKKNGTSQMTKLFHNAEDTLIGSTSQLGLQNIATTSFTKQNDSPVVIAPAEVQRFNRDLYIGNITPQTTKKSSKYISLDDFFVQKFGSNVLSVT